MITQHQYLKKYPISKSSKKLIVGTIHPHFHEKFALPFFYGNKLSLWNLLNEAFHYSEGESLTLKSILAFLEKHQISISDTILECRRIKPTALDKDLAPLLLNHGIVDQIKNSEITEIFFTSGFGKNNAFKLFYADILKLKITAEIKRNREVILDESIFGRPVKLTILYSPSGAANIALSTSKIYQENKDNYLQSNRPVYDFKIDYYKEKLGGNSVVDLEIL